MPLARSLSITALAPVEVVAAGFHDPLGIAADEAGTLYVSDADAGTITRIDPDGRLRVVARGLRKPAGLAFDPAARLLIAEEGSGRVLGRDSFGASSVVASGIKKPRWLAVEPDGTIYVVARGLRTARERGEHDVDDDHDKAGGDVVVRLEHGVAPEVFVDGVEGLQAIAHHAGSLYAVAGRLGGKHEHASAAVVRISIGASGQPGALEPLVRVRAQHPIGLVVDRLGAVFFTVKRLRGNSEEERRGLILKWLPDGRLETFAAGLHDPRGLALEAAGHLLTVDEGDGHRDRGRLLRFRAPAPPELHPPAFTNRSPVVVPGTAEAGSRVSAHRLEEPGTMLATAMAGAPSGSFTLRIPLVTNAENHLILVTTGAGGLGLTSARVDASIVHDDVPPSLRILQPLGGAFVRQVATLVARATDGGSGVASVVFTLDGQLLGTLPNSDPLQVFTASLAFDSTRVADGVHTLAITAQDRAGNVSSATQSLIVDNTEPETEITAGPAGETSDTTAVFTVTGMDALTPVASLEFAWRLDEGSWSGFAPETTVMLRGLAEGAHIFEVKARDLAGNEDLTAARRAFTVSLLGVTITEPADRDTVPEGLLLVRGTVQAGGVEVGVTVNDAPAAVQGTSFAALVPVTPATTSLTARATTARGQTTSHQVAIAVTAAPAPPVVLLASPASGVAPATVRFSILSDVVATRVDLDADGDGVDDFTGARLERQPFTFSRPGLYTPQVTVTDKHGAQFTAATVVVAYDQMSFDVQLRAKWSGMRDALRRADIEGALQFVAIDSKQAFRTDFTIMAAFLPTLAAGLEDIRFVAVRGNFAECELLTVENGRTLSYYVEFIRDVDGIWRLAFF